MANQKLVEWVDSEGFTCSKWVDLTAEEQAAHDRRKQIEADVAASTARTNSTIFGYSWEQIQRMQRGGK